MGRVSPYLVCPLLLLTLHLVGSSVWHLGRYHGPRMCSLTFRNGSSACFERCPEMTECQTWLPWQLITGFRRLGVDLNSVRVCRKIPCNATSCPPGYTCESYYARRQCYRSPCRSNFTCPLGTICTGWPYDQMRCFPQPCGPFDRCPANFDCLEGGWYWRRCYPSECRTSADCNTHGSTCQMGSAGRRCIPPTGQCDNFMDRNHAMWHLV